MINNLKDAEREIKQLRRTIDEMTVELRRMLPVKPTTIVKEVQPAQPIIISGGGGGPGPGSGTTPEVLEAFGISSQLHLNTLAGDDGIYMYGSPDAFAMTLGAKITPGGFVATRTEAWKMEVNFITSLFTIAWKTGLTPGVAFGSWNPPALRLSLGGTFGVPLTVTGNNYVKTNSGQDFFGSAT